uniref:5'-3' DNA helicase ZGRF1 n=1 Tax=Callorhinchus milii TaxID=7868 RepID=A0A4W3HK53_CALMI
MGRCPGKRGRAAVSCSHSLLGTNNCSSGSKATLFDEKGLCLDYVHVKPEEIKSGDDLESDRYLITVEEEKAPKNDQAACPHQKEAPKLGTISKRPAIPTRCHLPVGLKRKYTGFQGPREIQSQKKVTVEEKDIVGVVMKSQEHSLSLPPQFYATSPLFSTSYMKERMTSVSGVSALPSVKDSTANLSREVASISSLPTAPYSNSIQKSNPKEEIHAFYSTAGPRIPQTSSIKGLCQKLQFTVANSRPGAHPHPEGVQENRRSKAQILALIDLSALPSPDVLETFNTKQQKSLPRGRSTTCTVENATSHPGVSCFDRSCSVIENESPRLEETRDAMESHDSSDKLSFPRAQVLQGTMVPKRQVTIPVTFLSPAHYRQVFTAALTEHLNILLYELSLKLHRVLSNVDLTQYSSEKSGGADIKQSFIPLCQHQQPAKLVMVKKEGPNKGRLFYTCDASKSDQCKFFKWLDNVKPIDSKQETGPQSKLMLADAKSISAFIRSQHIHFYGECQLHVRRTFNFHNRKFCRGKLKELRNDEDLENTCQPKLYLRLSRKENSSVYSRDDLWIVSKTLAFDPLDTFIACSVFFGPSSANEVEILPLKGYSPSNWPSDMIVHALFVGNASTEFTSLRNLQEHVNPASLPLMPYLLKMSYTGEEAVNRSARGRFNSPALKRPMPQTRLLCPETTLVMAMEMMHVFHLNPDQAAALRQIAIMMASSKSPQESVLPITVIHGVYGAGKSYLLAVVVLFLSQLFEESECVEGPRQVPWKLLISSSTNVAVDRVLLGLLNLGFDRFIRVGSIRKIAKPILPYSLHAGSDNEELRELQALLKEDLTPVEKVHVRKSIEQHKLGRNKAMLREVRVVGVTCAACPFQCLNNLSFPMVVLDECSQMTEPSSLLPIARFGCEKLILVGDPKQLQPTIQGSDSAHEAGLEQTLFDRMCLMGHTPILLRTQYRCHPSISAITNELFYDGLLMDGVSASDRTPLLDWLPTLCFYSVKGREQVERDSSFHNSEEAAFTVKLIQSLIASGIEGSMIGVITLYKSQMHKVRNPAEMKAIQVSTVDAFQGAEKEIIVLSCVRTHQVGFIDSEKRMNVALTRGKRHLQIVGNLNCLRSNKLWERVIHHCEVKENGLKHAYQCEQELDMILKSYGDKRIDEKTRRGQKKLKSRSKSREHIEVSILLWILVFVLMN